MSKKRDDGTRSKSKISDKTKNKPKGKKKVSKNRSRKSKLNSKKKLNQTKNKRTKPQIEKSSKVKVKMHKKILKVRLARKTNKKLKHDSKKTRNIKKQTTPKKKLIKKQKGWHGEKEKHVIASKGLKISQYKIRKKLFSIIFILGFLIALLPLIELKYFELNFIGLPLILLAFFGYHYLTKIKEEKVFNKKRRFIDYVSLFLFLVFIIFTIIFFILEKWFLMVWGFLLICLTLIFYSFLIKEKLRIFKILKALFGVSLSATIVLLLRWYEISNPGGVKKKFSSIYDYITSLVSNIDSKILMGIMALVSLIILITLIIVRIRRGKTKKIKGSFKESKKIKLFTKEKEKEYRKKRKTITEKPIKLRELRLGETSLDLLYELLKEREQLNLKDIVAIFSIDIKQAEEWGQILEKNNLAELHFPLLGSPQIKIIKEKNKDSDNNKIEVAESNPEKKVKKNDKETKIEKETENKDETQKTEKEIIEKSAKKPKLEKGIGFEYQDQEDKDLVINPNVIEKDLSEETVEKEEVHEVENKEEQSTEGKIEESSKKERKVKIKVNSKIKKKKNKTGKKKKVIKKTVIKKKKSKRNIKLKNKVKPNKKNKIIKKK
ncbi:MAG: hypothetical protein ABIG93_04035 [archaeon]